MSCGTPIAGYDNEAFRGMVERSGAGWLSPLDDPEQLAGKIAEIRRDRVALAKAAQKSLEFAAQHTFEKTMQMRVEHMLSCSRLAPRAAEEALVR